MMSESKADEEIAQTADCLKNDSSSGGSSAGGDSHGGNSNGKEEQLQESGQAPQRERSRSRDVPRNKPREEEKRVIKVPVMAAGAIIGPKGLTVKQLSRESSAKIDVAFEGDEEREVTISGASEAIEAAIKVINEIVETGEAPKRWENIESENSKSWGDNGWQDGGQQGTWQAPERQRSRSRGERGGKKTEIRVVSEAEDKKVIMVPVMSAGALIGPKGQTIKRLTRESGAKIDVAFEGDEEREVTVSGAPDAIETAIKDIREIVETGEVPKRWENTGSETWKSWGDNGWQDSGQQGTWQTPERQRSRSRGERGSKKAEIRVVSDAEDKKVITVPVMSAGALIGPKGQTIKRLTRESSAKIDVAFEGDDEREVTISGAPEAIEVAIKDIKEIVETGEVPKRWEDNGSETWKSWGNNGWQDSGWQNSGQAKIRVVCEAEDKKVIMVPVMQAGAIIGPKGQTIKQVTRESGAKVDVAFEGDEEREVTITGTPETIGAASKAIEYIVRTGEAPPPSKDSSWGDNSWKEGRWQDSQDGDNSGWKSKKWNSQDSHGDDESDWKGSKWKNSDWNDSAWDNSRKRKMQIPLEFVGMLIGKGGESIKQLQEQSGADVKIAKKDDDEEDPGMKTVTVSGDPEAVDKAIQMVEQIVGRAVRKVGNSDSFTGLPTLLEPPPGFEPCEHMLFMFHRGQNLYFERSTGNLCWKDAAGQFQPFHRGLELPYSFKGHASVRLDKGNTAAKQPAPKNVVIPDLHRAGTALKMNLDHLDRPAALFGVYGNADGEKGVPADVTARTFHGELLKRLSSSRSQWQDESFLPALSGALLDIATANGDRAPTAAIALVVGHRVAALATRGAKLCVFTGAPPGEAQVCEITEIFGGAATCYQEVGLDFSSAVSVVLTVGETCLDPPSITKAVFPQISQSRCRASNLSLLRALKNLKAVGSVAIACARVAPVVNTSVAPASDAKIVSPKARIQQILIRYWKGTGNKPVDPVRRRKQISRTLEEAELLALDVLERLSAEGASFSSICKASSECPSALKGGDLAGDLGWVERSDNVALKAARNELVVLQDVVNTFVPDPVMKAAFHLEIGELSDLVTSDIGIHLLWRTG